MPSVLGADNWVDIDKPSGAGWTKVSGPGQSYDSTTISYDDSSVNYDG